MFFLVLWLGFSFPLEIRNEGGAHVGMVTWLSRMSGDAARLHFNLALVTSFLDGGILFQGEVEGDLGK